MHSILPEMNSAMIQIVKKTLNYQFVKIMLTVMIDWIQYYKKKQKKTVLK